ncbi:MAG: hypothetical protein LLG02_13435 [Pelosinus sp.]|nr:hypothetical protein [Pelosinus sp.]
MTIKSDDKKKELLDELGEGDLENLNTVFNYLDSYPVTPPPTEATDHLLALLTPVLQENSIQKDVQVPAAHSVFDTLTERLELIQAQLRLFSRGFVILSVLFFLCGLSLTTALDGDTLRFLANASPLLGILTVIYQFRAQQNHMNELEAACPYTPAQLASARISVVLVYDILLCLAATSIVSYGEDYVLWQVVTHWLAPLLLTLGIALLGSLRFGIFGGSLLSTAAWAFNLAASKDGNSLFSFLLPHTPVMYVDLLGAGIGLILLCFAFSGLHGLHVWEGDNQST